MPECYRRGSSVRPEVLLQCQSPPSPPLVPAPLGSSRISSSFWDPAPSGHLLVTPAALDPWTSRGCLDPLLPPLTGLSDTCGPATKQALSPHLLLPGLASKPSDWSGPMSTWFPSRLNSTQTVLFP
ncbi:uncharacterized protein V3H82_021100 [Fundulus diaphanus]